jgi:uncharacterized membrane protein YphA (DoxX/SURF4 family)
MILIIVGGSLILLGFLITGAPTWMALMLIGAILVFASSDWKEG